MSATKATKAVKSRKKESVGAPKANPKPNPDWTSLLSSSRRPKEDSRGFEPLPTEDARTDHERDLDRVVFCTPVRRLKDKTQVFPLDMHDGVRTRLTHSLEVSNLARSMGIAVTARIPGLKAIPDAIRNVPALLSTIALTHDLGNPPFGHQGEVAIRTWVELNEPAIKAEAKKSFNRELLKDFLNFEGNAQGFRILARLQHQDHRTGLRLTASTLRAFMKYPWMSTEVGKPGVKKFGVFYSEKEVFEWASAETRLSTGQRHPLSYLMEVCDDIAYSILDIEDAVKKEIVSVAEFASYVGNHPKYNEDARVSKMLAQYNHDRNWLYSLRMPGARSDEVQPLSSKEIRDSQVDILRSYVIGLMVGDAIESFIKLENKKDFHSLKKGIAEDFESKNLVDVLKEFARLRVYSHPSVLRAELQGHSVIPELMGAFWKAVVSEAHGIPCKAEDYLFSKLSPNYVRVYRQSIDLPLWYRQLQLVCDHVCGMTDSYALRLHAELKELSVI
ncbi:deoxyguanosinetriphosphate triphosphohydrolase family protein [Xanthomonas sacchari]|uniref:deoxyguanosinetriphosphate triphosphohydrolase family protein n=1 Tax=Xanthomonas sacchari TaxID=56458 RepID=UPI0022539428|nr:dNTP triphosphohydrolase [Xanthomonas sacchari]MCW0453735.1 Deoxyguanosinetriphosphate triphosphohydrolase [Xanthomonas sacchari]